jgi:DNA-binding NarL/FixJ family response regulator
MMMPIRILIADDHAVFRSGLRALLEKEPDLEIVGETGNGFDTIRAVAERDVDVLLLDITMPGLPGAKVAEAVLKEEHHPAIVVLTMHEDEYYLQEFFRLGVLAYVLKKSTATDVVQAIRAARRGEEYIDPALAGLVISSYVGRRQPRRQKTGRVDQLTPREQEVLSLLAYGHTNGEIGQKLSISERTVETHRTNIMTKLDLTSRADLVRFAIDNGLLRLG